MPIFEVDGQQFEVEDKYVSDFAKEYPNAVTKVDSEDAIYEVSASDYPAYLDTQRASRRVVPEKTTIPGSHAKPYQITPEEMGFENVLDKDNFQERYGVSPSVMERQTDPIKESVQRLRAKVGSRSNIPQYPIGNRYTFGFGSDYANKEADNIASSQLSAATENELRGAEKAQSKDGFWKSFGKGLKDEGMWTQGLTELDNNLTLAYIAKKAEKEGFDKLPEKEQDLLTASALRIASEAANSDEKTALQIAGMSTAESIPYMLQFMLTSSPASLATSPVRSAIKKAAEKAIKSGISSKLIPVVKGAARTAAVTTKAMAMTAMQPTMYADMVSRGTGKATLENGQYAGMEEAESAPIAAYKAFANATIENLSEHSGSMLSGATKAAGNVLKKVPALGGFISNVQKNNVLSGVNKMMKAVGFNGAPEEFFEEQVSTGLNSLLVGDSQFSDFVNWKQQLATLISVGATAGAMTTTGTIMSVPYKKEIKRKYEEATDKVYDYFTPEEFDQFSSSLSRMDIDSRPDFIAQVSDMKGFSPEQIKGLVEFATRQAQFDGYAGAVSDYIEDEKVRAQEEIDRVSNKNMGEVLQVNGIGENPVNIVGGFVVFDDEGFVDKKKSSQTIYYLDEDGKRKMASPDKFGELVSRKPLSEAYAEALGNVENDILIQEENELSEEDTPEQAQQDAMILAENGNQVETPDGVGTISQVEQDENAAIVTFQDGRSKRYSISTLKPYVDPSLQPAENLQTEQPTAQTELQTEQPQVTQAPSFPVDKEGNIDYTQIQEPEQYAQALQQEFEGDAVSVIDEQIQSAQAKLEKAGKNADAIKKRRAMKAAQMELDRLNNVKSLLTPSEQIVNETIPETVENEEASPSEQSNVIDLSQLTEPERRRYVVDNSTDPIELADIYEQSKDEVDYAQMMPWEAALVGRKVSKDSFIENSDKNNITGAMSRSWFSKDGKGLDVLAQELSEFGVPVTEQDIVNFIMSHPGNSIKKRSQLSIDADRRFKETVKELTGQDVGGVESSSGKLILAGLRAGQRSEQERQALPFSTYTIPDSVLNFFEETGINPEDFDTFEELRDAVSKEQENGTFVFPLGETDLQIINNIINHGIKQQANYANFAARVEKAGTKRAAEQPVLETAAGNQLEPITIEPRTEAGTTEQVTGEEIEFTPEEIAEIESQLEVKKRPDNIFEAISEIAIEQDIRDAEKEVNTTPTEAQKEAGNYKMGHVNIQGLDVSIENPKGSQRSGKDDTGQEWSVTLNNSYGYIKGTRGKDGDHVDVFLGDNPSSENVFVIDQVNKDGSFDEHKVMLGFNSQEEAEAAYKSNYSEGWTGLGSVTPMTIDDFKAWVTEGKKNEPATQEIAEDIQTTNNNEVQETKSNYRTQDGKQLNFTFAEGLQNTNESANVESGSNDVQREGDPILGTLNRELKDGEFCKVERIFTESKAFDFTAGTYIDSVHDVAYIFKQLEDESVENSFAVLVKDGKPTIIHLGMGVYTSTQLNGTAILSAAERINPDKIFFIHNHPSGNLKPSQADKNVYSQLYSLFGDKLEDAIIINLKSGKFAMFNSNYDIEQTNYTPNKTTPVKVYSFNKQVFGKNYNPSNNFKITSPGDVASFISGHRLGDRKKMNIMVVNNGVVANMFTKYTSVTENNVEEVAKEAVLIATNYGGIAVVVYGDIGNISDNAVAKLKKLIGIYSGGQISLLDFISVEGNNYKSSIEEGLMEPVQEYPADKVNEDEILFRDGNDNVPLSYRFDNENCEYYVRFSDHIDDDMKRGWSSWNFGSGGFEGTKEELEKAKKEAIENEDSFTISEYELWGNEIKKADIRELYPNYWVLVDNVNASGGLSAHELPSNLETLEDALSLVDKNQSIYDGTGDGQKFKASEGNVIYSKGNMHIIEVGTNEKQNSLSETDQIKAESEKNGTFMKAPNGKDSNLNEKQWLQVRTKAFKEWFGDWENDPENASKVVDENGEPLVVYHSGAQNINEFSLDYKGGGIGRQLWGTGFYFSTSINKANNYARRYEKRNKKPAQIYPAFVDLKNPAYTALGEDTKNYDGAILIDKDKTKSEDYQLIVLSPNQIKSATENTGEFNPNNDDIRFRDAELDRLDKEYLDAVESGDMEKAQKIVDYVAQKNGYVSSSDYRLSHRAPSPSNEGVRMDQVMSGDLVPADYWTTPRYYLSESYDYESYRNVKKAIKEGKITMYRSIPKDAKDSKFRNGDWVTPSREYARQEGLKINGPYRIIEETIPVENAYWDGNDINEWGVDDGKGYSYKNTKNNKKLNETVTRDDEGNIIPPSKRFNDRKSDPRYRGAFYSNAENAVKSIKQDKATPEQWLKMIEKTGGLKAGEDKWMGLSEWLKNSEAKTLTKQDVLDYIRQNQIVVEEVELGEGKDKKVMTGEAMHNIDILDMSINYINNSLVEGSEDYDKGLRSILSNANSLPGFEWIQTVDDLKKAKEMVINSPESYATVKVSDIDPTRLDYTTKGLDNKKEIVLTVPSIKSWNADDEIHFGDVSQGREVGWVRFGETTDSEGNRVMVIDEIQSKRHQEGREKGYANSILTLSEEQELKTLLDRYFKVSEARRTRVENDAIPLTAEEAYRMTELMQKNKENANKVPDAPFDKNWHELVMKRALKYAAENGFDKVAWTKGEQQAQRYDIGGVVKSIEVHRATNPETGEVKEGMYDVYTKDRSGNDLYEASGLMDNDKIVSTFGKDLGMRIIEKAEREYIAVIEGEGLRIGGEGMKGFYDKILPSFMNKYGKRWGVKVGEVTLPNVEESARAMHSIDVTEDMKASVMEGQPMFKDSSSETKELSNVEKEATTLADSLNTPIRVVRDVNEITNEDKRKEKRMRSAKGWYDPKTGEVVIVLPNADSVGDVQATILHEVVGHKGLRGLLGDKFEEMMDKVYKHLPKKERQKIMAAAMDKYKFDYRTATEEYLAEFVERDVMEPSLWQKIKSAIKSFFRNMGVNLEMSDPDIAYLLWKSKNRLQSGDALSKINSVAKDLEAKERFREAPYTEADVLSDQLDDASKRAWESLSRDQRTVHEMVNETAELRKGVLKYFPTKEGVKKSIYELTQGLFDNAVSLKALQNLVNEVSNEPIESYANPYQFLTTIPARNEHKMKTFVKTKYSKIGQAIKEMGVPQSTAQVYAYLKHGIERNRYMRGKDIEGKTRKLQEEAEKRIDPIRDSIEYLSQKLETADKKNTQRILAKIEGYNQAILDIQSETQVKASEYAQKVEDKDYSGVFQVADLFIQEMEDRKMTVAQIESAIEQFEKEHDTTNFWEAVSGATKWTVQNEFEMGRISKEVRDKIFSMYEYYIPLKGWEEENANEVWDYMSGQGIPVSPIKKAGGRKSLAQNPFENIGLAAQTSIMGGHKNLLKLHALRMVRNYPNKLYRVSEVWVVDEGDNWVMKAPEYSDNAETYAENVIKFEEEMNELKEQGLAKKVMGKLDVGKPITKYEAKEHEVLVYENGKPYIIYINDNPDIARAINMTSTKPYEVGGNDPSGKDWMKKGLNGAMNLMRFTGQNLTSRNPAFVAANLVMDTQWAIAAASAKEGSAYAKKLVGNYMSSSVHSSILRGVRGKLDESNPMDKMFADFQRAGGETGYSDLFKLEDFQKMLKEGLNEGTDWRKVYTWYTGSIDMLNRWAELASRFSTFVTSRNSGRDIERSAYDAKEITLNFNRKGTGAFLGNWLKFAYLFAGAGLQGAYSMANLALSKRSQKRITMVFAGTAMLGLIIPLINDMFLGGDDDELYSKKPDYERKSNFLIRIPGSDSFFKLPISQPLRPFYNIGETLYQMVKGNRNAGEGTMDIIGGFGMLLPFDPFGGSSLVPSAFQPVFQVKENKDFFGQKIYKDDSFTQYDPEFKRAFSNTSPAFVELTRALNEITGGDEVTKGMVNVNPAILEHLVEGYLGGAFKFVNDIGKQVNGAIEVSKGNAYPYDSRSYPIVGRFYTNTAASSDINAEYYKVINDSEELNHRVRKYQELGRKGDSEAFEKSLELMNSPEYKKAIFVKAFKKRIDDLKKMAKDGNMENNPVLKGQERELKIIMLNEIEKLDEK